MWYDALPSFVLVVGFLCVSKTLHHGYNYVKHGTRNTRFHDRTEYEYMYYMRDRYIRTITKPKQKCLDAI